MNWKYLIPGYGGYLMTKDYLTSAGKITKNTVNSFTGENAINAEQRQQQFNSAEAQKNRD